MKRPTQREDAHNLETTAASDVTASPSPQAAGDSESSGTRLLTPERVRRTQGVRARAVLIGLALVPLLCWWVLRTEIISGGSELIEASLLVVVVFVLFALVLLNETVKHRFPTQALTRAELIVIYIMQTTSLGLAGLGQIQFLNQLLGGAYYYAKPENKWAEFHPFIPQWWVPDPKVLPDYYAGASSLFTVPHLRGWAGPIIVWSAFLLLMLFCFLCLNTLFRRHWIENERLTFPLVALPLELTNASATRSLLRERMFWFAFVIACVYRSVSGLHRLLPDFPDVPGVAFKGQEWIIGDSLTEPPWSAIGFFVLSLHPLIVGITYFLPLDVAFSMWFFYLLVKGENVLAGVLGYRDAGASASAALFPYTGEQGAGAFLGIALFAFWGARRHIQAVLRKAFRGDPKISDADEPLSYRTAVIGFLVSFTLLVAFVASGGMEWHLAAIFFALYLLMITTCTRLRAEAGPMISYGPDMNPHQMMVVLPGSQSWSMRNLVPFTYLIWFDSDYRTVAMPQQMDALKMADVAGLPPRRLSLWMLMAGGLAAITAFLSVLAIYYHYGAITARGDNNWRVYNGRTPFTTMMSWLQAPTRFSPQRLEWIGVGFLVIAALTKARSLWPWWPFHPAGFALAHAGYSMPWVWFPTLLGWIIKVLVLRYGGIKLFRSGIPFFMGLLLGDIVIACLWSILGVFLNTQMYMFFPG